MATTDVKATLLATEVRTLSAHTFRKIFVFLSHFLARMHHTQNNTTQRFT